MTESAQVATLWFDPVCPWAWMTSRWLLEVEKVRDVRVDWQVMSLAVLNENQDVDPEHREILDRAWGPVRVLTAARIEHGVDTLKPLYEAMGTRIHHGGERDYGAVIAAALEDTGLPATLASAAHTDTYDKELRASHSRGIALVGEDVGTPVVAVGDVAFFGPVVSPAPRGAAAGRLWDGCLLVAGTPGFFEIKRTRTHGPIFEP